MQRFDVSVDLLVGFGPDQFDPGVADQVPAGKVLVAAVNRVTEHPLPGVFQHEGESTLWRVGEIAGFESGQQLVLSLRGGGGETIACHRAIERRQHGLIEWQVGAIVGGKGAIDEDVNAGFVGAGAEIIGGNEAPDDSAQRSYLSLGESDRLIVVQRGRGCLGKQSEPGWDGLGGDAGSQGAGGKAAPATMALPRSLLNEEMAAGDAAMGQRYKRCSSLGMAVVLLWVRQPSAEEDPCAHRKMR